jgi:hypothetical protein
MYTHEITFGITMTKAASTGTTFHLHTALKFKGETSEPTFGA